MRCMSHARRGCSAVNSPHSTPSRLYFASLQLPSHHQHAQLRTHCGRHRVCDCVWLVFLPHFWSVQVVSCRAGAAAPLEAEGSGDGRRAGGGVAGGMGHAGEIRGQAGHPPALRNAAMPHPRPRMRSSPALPPAARVPPGAPSAVRAFFCFVLSQVQGAAIRQHGSSGYAAARGWDLRCGYVHSFNVQYQRRPPRQGCLACARFPVMSMS